MSSSVVPLIDCTSPSTSGSGTDASDDSVEVRLQPISGLPSKSSCKPIASTQLGNCSKKNKRKSSEPRKFKHARKASNNESIRWISDDDEGQKDEDCKSSKLLKTDDGTETRLNSILNEKGHFILNLPFDIRNILGPSAATLLSSRGPNEEEQDEDDEGGDNNRFNNRNYKSMTRERRIEANARERTRVHTISAAFENLRQAVPSYSCHQKLSKLAILRIACSYIVALANLNDLDYSCESTAVGKLPKIPTFDGDNIPSPSSFAQCVDLCTKTIQLEGKIRKRKD